MPEVRRGSRTPSAIESPVPMSPAANDVTRTLSDLPPVETALQNGALEHQTSNTPSDRVRFSPADRSNAPPLRTEAMAQGSNNSGNAVGRPSLSHRDTPRKSLSYAQRPPEQAYTDSRAATHTEYERRARTLEEYYDANPHLLPQLPFTWHHGWKRFRLGLLIFMMFVDACAVPIALYYGMHYAGNVQGWIIFAIVTTVWGGPTYLEFAIRTLRLIKKERFYRPLGSTSRWCMDYTTWVSIIAITAVTALFIVGSAPHIVWLRVLCMPGPALLYSLCGCLFITQLYSDMKWKAPFRLSSTDKGEPVLAGAYYFIEDVVAVNAGGGLPYREAIAARYKASPRFRKMLWKQSWFWSVPGLIIAIPLTVIALLHDVPPQAAYGVCWAVPFLWALLWGAISIWWCKKDMVNERLEWESDNSSTPSIKNEGIAS